MHQSMFGSLGVEGLRWGCTRGRDETDHPRPTFRQEMNAQGAGNSAYRKSYACMMSDRQWVPGGGELDKLGSPLVGI